MKNEKSNMSGSKLTGAEISAYFRKNPKAKAVKKAVEIALDHGGAMSYAIKEIEKLKKGLHKHPEVKKALQYANESVTYKESLNTMYNILSENYTRNFDLLCNSIKLNKVQQKILDQFINHGTIKNQYVGRVAGVKKEKKFFAAKKAYKGSIENRNEALMRALKVNATQKNILDAYLKTGKVIGKYAGSIAGSTKSTKSYSAFRGFKESYDLLEGNITKSKYYKDRDRKGHEGRLVAVGVKWTDIEKSIIATKFVGKAHMSSFDGSSSNPKEVEVMGDLKALNKIALKLKYSGKVSVDKNPFKEHFEIEEKVGQMRPWKKGWDPAEEDQLRKDKKLKKDLETYAKKKNQIRSIKDAEKHIPYLLNHINTNFGDGKGGKLSDEKFHQLSNAINFYYNYEYLYDSVNEAFEIEIKEYIDVKKIAKAFPKVAALKNDRIIRILQAKLSNDPGYNDILKLYQDNPKAFIDNLKHIAKNDRNLAAPDRLIKTTLGRPARGLTKKQIGEDSVNEAVGRAIKLDWDMGDPREYAADWKDAGVYLDAWVKAKSEIEVSGTDLNLQMWLTDEDEGYGMSTKDAAKLIRKSPRVRL